MTLREMEIAFGAEVDVNPDTILAGIHDVAWAVYNTQTDTTAYFPERNNVLYSQAQSFAAWNKIVANNAAAHTVA